MHFPVPGVFAESTLSLGNNLGFLSAILFVMMLRNSIAEPSYENNTLPFGWMDCVFDRFGR